MTSAADVCAVTCQPRRRLHRRWISKVARPALTPGSDSLSPSPCVPQKRSIARIHGHVGGGPSRPCWWNATMQATVATTMGWLGSFGQKCRSDKWDEPAGAGGNRHRMSGEAQTKTLLRAHRTGDAEFAIHVRSFAFISA